MPLAFGPAPSSATYCEVVEVVDHGFGVVAELHERDADDGAGATASTHAVHRDPDPAVEVVTPFEDTHFGTKEMTVRDPDGRIWSLQAPAKG